MSGQTILSQASVAKSGGSQGRESDRQAEPCGDSDLLREAGPEERFSLSKHKGGTDAPLPSVNSLSFRGTPGVHRQP